jgi:hypothetical protein
MTAPDLIGFVGVSAVLATYFLVQAERMDPRAPRYQILNMLGSALIAYSLLFAFNLPALVIQALWFAISAYGLIRSLLPRNGGKAR